MEGDASNCLREHNNAFYGETQHHKEDTKQPTSKAYILANQPA